MLLKVARSIEVLGIELFWGMLMKIPPVVPSSELGPAGCLLFGV
jgi:hypothetical protein